MKIISIKRKCHEKSMAFYHKWWGTIGVTMDRQRNYVLVRSAIFKLSSSLCIYSKTCLNCRHHYVYTVKPVYLLTDRLRPVRVCLLRKNKNVLFFCIFYKYCYYSVIVRAPLQACIRTAWARIYIINRAGLEGGGGRRGLIMKYK